MNQAVFVTGLIASIILVLGSAWPDRSSYKNWIFALGNFGMLGYSILSYLNGNPVFYILLESLCALSSVLMLAKVRQKPSTILLLSAGAALLAYSIYLFEDTGTLFFILGLMMLAVGFVTKDFLKRNSAFVLGSALIAIFSYVENSMIFFWLNVFFALFSFYYLLKAARKR